MIRSRDSCPLVLLVCLPACIFAAYLFPVLILPNLLLGVPCISYYLPCFRLSSLLCFWLGDQNRIRPRQISDPKKFPVQIFFTQTNFRSNFFLDLTIFPTQFFLDPTSFVTQHFFDPNFFIVALFSAFLPALCTVGGAGFERLAQAQAQSPSPSPKEALGKSLSLN